MTKTISNIKKFDGERFVFEKDFLYKSDANKEKQRLKASGVRKVRIVPVGNMYVVYKRSL